MAVVSFPARNKLGYPAGRLAGFDPNHIAASNCPFSGVATYGGSFCHLLSRVKSTEGGTKTSSIYGGLGPITNYVGDGATTQDSTVFPFTASTAANTLAAIFKVTATPPTTAYLLNTSATGAFGIGDVNANTVLSAFIVSAAFSTTTAYVAGYPYFFAMSINASTVNWVVVRMDTGATTSGSGANGNFAVPAGDGTITVGSRGTNARQINGGIAAAMASNAYMSEPQLRKWAEDPWAFWYPPQASSLVAAAAATPTTVLYSLMNVG